MANNQITPFQLTDQFTMDNFNQRINETNIALQKKADLGEDGKVPESQLPAMDYASAIHASQHAKGGSDPVTPEDIGAAASIHTHDDRYYTETEVNNLLSAKAPAYSYGTSDLTAGSSSLATGKLYFVYE